MGFAAGDEWLPSLRVRMELLIGGRGDGDTRERHVGGGRQRQMGRRDSRATREFRFGPLKPRVEHTRGFRRPKRRTRRLQLRVGQGVKRTRILNPRDPLRERRRDQKRAAVTRRVGGACAAWRDARCCGPVAPGRVVGVAASSPGRAGGWGHPSRGAAEGGTSKARRTFSAGTTCKPAPSTTVSTVAASSKAMSSTRVAPVNLMIFAASSPTSPCEVSHPSRLALEDGASLTLTVAARGAVTCSSEAVKTDDERLSVEGCSSVVLPSGRDRRYEG